MDRRQRFFGNRVGFDYRRMRSTPTMIGAVLLAAAGIAVPLRASEISPAERRSGYSFMTPATQAIQNDARASRRGAAARYPAFDPKLGRPVNLEQRINLCRVEHQQASPLAYESHDLLALTAFVAEQSRGMPIEPGADPQLAPFVAKGRELFMHRQGQLNLACATCHNDNWDKHLAGSAITQAQPTGYPMYRLEWQSLGSLERRLRSCMIGVRAQPFDYGSPELVELELYLMSRAQGMSVETPAVRP